MRWYSCYALSLLGISSVACAIPTYEIVDLGELGNVWVADSINAHGQVAGVTKDFRPFRWSPSSGFEYFNAPAGAEDVVITALNDFGQMVGSIDDQAAFWDAAGVPTLLGSLGDGGLTRAFDINNLGQVIGESAGTYFMWTAAGGMRAFPGGNAASSFLQDINNVGQIVGFATGADGATDYAIWNPDGTVQTLVPSSGTVYQGRLNDLGYLVSTVRNDDTGNAEAAYRTYGGDIVRLGSFEGRGTIGNHMNNRLQVVGQVASPVGPALLWDSGQAYLLDELVSDLGSWELLRSARGISDGGFIVGTGFMASAEDGVQAQHAFVLRPLAVSAPGTLALVMLGLAILALLRRRPP